MRPPLHLRLALLSLLAVAVAFPRPVAGWEVDPEAPAAQLEEFHRHFAAAAYPYPRHGASPLGLTGFDLFVEATYAPEFDDPSFAGSGGAIRGDLTGGFLSVGRIGVRKGLPGGVDLGVSYGRALGSDLDVLAGEVQWAFVKGGAATPALALRLAGGGSEGSDAYELRQLGAELVLSKGFAVVTPFVGGGIVRSDGTFRRAAGELTVDSTQGVVFGGLTLHLLVPRITVEVERGETLQGVLRVGIGF